MAQFLTLALGLSGCAYSNGARGGRSGGSVYPLVARGSLGIGARLARSSIVTDRVPNDGSARAFGARALAHSALRLARRDHEPGAAISAATAKTGPPQALGAFPETPYPTRKVPGGVRRDPATVRAHEAARTALQRAFAERLAQSPRKEAIVFVHGYNNSFEDSARYGAICARSRAMISPASC
jgi:esterase/lipase superfamily enzyme